MPVIQKRNSTRCLLLSCGLLATVGCIFAVRSATADDDDALPTKPRVAKLVGSLLGDATDADTDTPPKLSASTHLQSGDIKIRGARSGHQLQTFCLNKDGLIFAVVGPPRPYGAKLEGKNNSAEIRVHDADGKELRQWSVDFAAQSIAVAPDGTVFVAGNGKIAKFDSEGTLIASADTPHVALLLKDSKKLKQEAEAQLKAEKEEYEDQVKQLNDQLDEQRKELKGLKDALEAKPEEERKAAEKRKVRSLELTIRNQEAQHKAQLQYYKDQAERSVDDIMEETASRLKIVNALAVSDRDVFIASGVVKGYGYAIWRTTPDFVGAEEIVSGLSGCCGQMDIRCCEAGVFVAENSRKRVLQYDRDGKKLGQFGEGDRNGSSGAKFGGCCNPMNICFGSGGDVFTAESEGYIKRFTKEGSFLGVVGQAKVSGGCKNVAISVSPDGERAYFFDLAGSRIVMLDKKAAKEKPAQDKAAAKAESKAKPRVGF